MINPRITAAALQLLDQADQTARLAADPAAWCAERLGDTLWSAQKRIMDTVAANPRTVVQSCHGIGKSWTCARLACWWIDVHPPGTALVVTTAPTYPQVHSILWEEIRAAHRKAGLPGRVTLSDEWILPDGTLAALGRKPADHDKHGFQGLHRPHMLVILDEACGIPDQLYTAAEALITGAGGRILAVGNPDDPTTQMHEVTLPGSGYQVITVSAMDTPAWTGEDIPARLLSQLVTPDWVDDKRRRWGEDSPLWQSKVLGRWPDTSADTLIRPQWITAAHELWADTPDYAGPPDSLGVDVARYGADHSIIGWASGPRYQTLIDIPSGPTTQLAGEVAATMRHLYTTHGATPAAHVDTVGVGGGVADILRAQHLPVRDMVAGAPSHDPDRWPSLRCEWWWHARDLLEAGRLALDPADQDLAAQLANIRWQLDPRGRQRIETKDAMAARGVHSPDRADALVMAYGRPGPDRRPTRPARRAIRLG